MAAGDRDRLLVEVRRAFGALAPDEAEERVAQVEALTRPAGPISGTMIVGEGDPLPRLVLLLRELEWEIGPRGYWNIDGAPSRLIIQRRPGLPPDDEVLAFLAAHRERVAELAPGSPRGDVSRSLLIARLVDLGWTQDDWGAKRILDRLAPVALATPVQPLARERMLAEIADALIRAQPARGDELAMALLRLCAPRSTSRRGPYAARRMPEPAQVLPEALLMVSNLDFDRRWTGSIANGVFTVRAEPRPPRPASD